MVSSDRVETINIEQEMRESYLDYAMSVITSRALPDVRDGLKPVQRRILYAMHELGLTARTSYRKSATVVGEVLGKYHPHGDAAVYDTLVRLAQDFNMRYPLIDGQGNFGSIDGDSAAAMRYTECRMAAITDEMLADIEKDTVNWYPNYDGREIQPESLPARVPNLLVNGATGIAVGMATNIPPHNLREVIDAAVHLIDHPEATNADLSEFVRGPDFPTGGIILGREGIDSAFGTGHGRITIRAVHHLEELRGGRFAIVVTEIPYMVNKATLLERIGELVTDKRITGISDLRDESDRQGMRIVIELKRDAQPKALLNQLFKHTALQTNFSINTLALADGQPRVLSLDMILRHFLNYRRDVVRRRTEFDLRKARERAHILEGLKIALDNLDKVIKTIRESRTQENARANLMNGFDLSEIQANAILAIQLARLAAMEQQKIRDEYAQIIKTIAKLEDLLANARKIDAVIKDELKALKDKYGDERRTRIMREEAGDFSEEDLVPDEEVVVTMTRKNYIKRIPSATYKPQRRGGKGIIGMVTRDADAVDKLFVTNTHDSIMFFTNRGRVFQLRVYDVPDATRQAKGTPVANLVQLDPNEHVSAVRTIPHDRTNGYLVMATTHGTVKRTALDQFKNVRRNGLRAITLDEGDELAWVTWAEGTEDIMLVTRKGHAIRFAQDQARSMGREAAGVRGIRLRKGDSLVRMDLVRSGSRDLLVVTERGFGKRTPLGQFRRIGRGGQGVTAVNLTSKTGDLVAARVVGEDDAEVILMSAEGLVTRTDVMSIRETGRAAQGVIVMRLNNGDTVTGMATLNAALNAAEGDE
ncbi:MAG TPA: DNA gyrase subunit A [Chloroflexota bacterium]|nr:DNA gyrase subunit A [Chloroflexota bacterium]